MSSVHAVILAGGSGTRFWPASRRDRPKQLLPLAGSEPLIAATVRRLDPLVCPERVWIATGGRIADATAAALPRVPRAQVLVEPVARNTAAPIGWAAATIARRDPDALVAVLPADHFIGDEPAFRAVLERALSAASDGWLTTVGIVPTRPETGYGYIEVGAPVTEGVSAVTRFVEKPDRAKAQEFLAGGKHLWNAGMFFFRASDMREAIAKHLPALGAGLDEHRRGGGQGRRGPRPRPPLPHVPLDLNRPRRHGEGQQARGRPWQLRLERHRQLGGRLGARRQGRRTATRRPRAP